jgi:glycosyltransferase involved in cell wall biosynthesis
LEKLGLDNNVKYITIFGNLRGYKGVGLLLNAWKVVVLEHPDVRLIIGGRLWTGQDFLSKVGAVLSGTRHQSLALADELRDLVKQGKILYFPGFLPDEMIDSLVRVSEFSVFPYEKFESQSGAACRAVGLGSPVLVSSVGGLPDLVIDESWIVEPGNLDDLIETLKLKIMDSKKGLEQVDLGEKLYFMSASAVAKATAELYLNLSRN